MLRLTTTKDYTASNDVEVPFSSMSVSDGFMVFTSSSNISLKNNGKGTIIGKHSLYSESDGKTKEYTFTQNINFIVDEGNPREFKIKCDDEYPLNVIETYQITNGTIINFDNPHFFTGSSFSLTMYYVSEDLSVQKESIQVKYNSITSVLYTGELPSDYELYRDDFRFKNADTLTITSSSGAYNLAVHLDNEYDTNADQYNLVNDGFIDKEMEGVIPRIVDMEKDIYTPIIKSIESDINEIEFNLHFREREGTDWTVKDDGYWNGYPNGVKNDLIVTFKTPEHQSDLLGFLDFNNNDVKYQKSKLKRSFIRLSFYDSNNIASQNLLYYSTIFMDGGKQFGKYVKYLDDEYKVPLYDEEGNIEPDPKIKTGITVDGEPYKYFKSDGTEVEISSKDDNFKENRRLSSRLTVKNRYNSDASSEGFYLYLFKEDDPNLRPRDLYMRVEFNHAGLGRTIPFMRPTRINEKTLENGTSMTIDEILSDSDFTDERTGLKGYDLETYYLHTHIQFKYEYNKTLKKHVYYIYNEDDLTIDVENRKLIINLYEAKVR